MNHSTVANSGRDPFRASRAGTAFAEFPTVIAALVVSLALSAPASAQTDVYKNTTTYLNNGVANGGTTDVGGSNLKTLMVADDITVAPGGAGLPINGYSFSVRNFNGVAVSARPLVTVYADNGANAANAAGDLLYSVTFAPQTYAANSVQVVDFSPGATSSPSPPAARCGPGSRSTTGWACSPRRKPSSTSSARAPMVRRQSDPAPTTSSSPTPLATTPSTARSAIWKTPASASAGASRLRTRSPNPAASPPPVAWRSSRCHEGGVPSEAGPEGETGHRCSGSTLYFQLGPPTTMRSPCGHRLTSLGQLLTRRTSRILPRDGGPSHFG